MGRRAGSVNKVDIDNLPRGVSMFRDGRAKPFLVRHRKLPTESFASAEAAVARKAELIQLEKNHGHEALSYDRATHADATAALNELPAGISLLDAARFWTKHHSGEDISCAEAISRFVDNKRAQSNRPTGKMTPHVHDLNTRLRRFSLAFGEQQLTEITSEPILHWLLELDQSPRSIKNICTALNNFFNYAARRRWITRSPMIDVTNDDLPKVRTSLKNPFSPDQAAIVMDVVRDVAPRCLLHFALRLWIGFRTQEAHRFRYEWILPDQKAVHIPGWFYTDDGSIEQGAKTGDAWMIDDVSPAFWRLYREHLATQSIDPKNAKGQIPAPYYELWIKLRSAILTELELSKWPDNACRDTFCTLHMSAYRSAERTALILKHTNAQTLWRSYLGTLINQDTARVFFEG